jgi:hypothetical protein
MAILCVVVDLFIACFYLYNADLIEDGNNFLRQQKLLVKCAEKFSEFFTHK